jgi:5-(carboxyamino)imidazole ribonucleotide mutase
MDKPAVGVLMGSDSDFETMKGAVEVLREFGIPFEVEVTSAHRSPERTRKYVSSAGERGLRVIIVGAGGAAHLGGVVAAETTLPVIGVPIDSSPLRGLDALLATVQMPGGVPVATMAVGAAGATNAGLFAVQILALSDSRLAEKLLQYKTKLAASVEEKSRKLQAELRKT